MQTVTEDIYRVRNLIEKSRKKYGILKKCEFHLHTPASHDYRLIPNMSFKDIDIKFLINYAVEVGYLFDSQRQILINELEKGNLGGIQYLEHIEAKGVPYSSLKEYLGYMLIAHKLYKESIEIAVVSDHNTILGYEKLTYALEEYFKERVKNKGNDKKAIKLFLGIEISCSDHNHVIGIFDHCQKRKVLEFIEQNISSESEGTFETAYSIINKISDIGGIPYIAHINTWSFSGTGFYKGTLFGSPNLSILGVTNRNQIEILEDKINLLIKGNKKKFCFIQEGDAHELDQIGQKNTWIKFSDIDFSSLKKALSNFQFCVYIDKPTFTDKFIKGIYIETGDTGFLSKNSNQEQEGFFVELSRDLNCIIGGRGTGKSTLLNIIQSVFSLEVTDYEQLKFLSKHERIYIEFTYQGENFLIRFIPQVGHTRSYVQRDFFLEKAFKESSLNTKGRLMLSDNWIELFKFNAEGGFTEINAIDRDMIFKNVYRNNYSINNIVNQVNQGEIGDFIRDVIFDGIQFSILTDFIQELKGISNKGYRKFLEARLPDIKNKVNERKISAESYISSFNEKFQDYINITYSPKNKLQEAYLEYLFEMFPMKEHIANTMFTWRDVENYVYQLVSKIGYLDFLSLLMSNQFSKLNSFLNISSMISSKKLTQKDVDEGYSQINDSNRWLIFKELQSRIIKNRYYFEISLEKYFDVVDDFGLKFDVNSKESIINSKPFMKNVEELSLGQKVSAILTFIFEYGMHSNDNTPLIIDQPEDNLDNQYIYKNLVNSLRKVKNQRQVIVVTHSSTIVTNADAEQVIVLSSNNKNGWVEKSGYPSNKTIMKYIILYLEGGVSSFQHKVNTYSTILNQ